MRSLIEDYIRESANVLEVTLFQVEAWKLSDLEKRKTGQWKKSQRADKVRVSESM